MDDALTLTCNFLFDHHRIALIVLLTLFYAAAFLDVVMP